MRKITYTTILCPNCLSQFKFSYLKFNKEFCTTKCVLDFNPKLAKSRLDDHLNVVITSDNPESWGLV